MGSNQFQMEYIEYLQERNAELHNKLTHLKENYENKIFSKDLSKSYLLSTLEDVLNVCITLPPEIDLFFDKMTAAMGILKDILLKKSQMVQLVEKITQTINSTGNRTSDLGTMEGCVKEQGVCTRASKKGGTVRVSPMINGHVISTNPRIYLSRVLNDFTPNERGLRQLSPIVEASPDTSSDTSRRNDFREVRIPLERLNLSKLLNEESPKGRFKGPKTWKKSLSTQKGQRDAQRCTGFTEKSDSVNDKTKFRVEVNEVDENGVDPLEGPSWLYANERNSTSPVRDRCFVDFRRRKHRFASVFDKNEDFSSGRLNELKRETLTHSEGEGSSNGIDVRGRETADTFKESVKTNNETSEAIICEVAKEPLSFGKYRLNISRECLKDSSDENELSDFEEDVKKNTSTYLGREVSDLKLDPFYEADNEDNPSEQKSVNKSYRRRCTRSLFEKSKSSSSDTTPVSRSTPRVELVIELENCSSSKELNPKLSKTMNSKEKKNMRSQVILEPYNPGVSLENQGRQKRKAAPSNLCEPKLSTKLRRN